MMRRSVRHTPATPSLTITSSGPAIVGSGTSSSGSFAGSHSALMRVCVPSGYAGARRRG
jgi:hypothetical protein